MRISAAYIRSDTPNRHSLERKDYDVSVVAEVDNLDASVTL